MLETMDRLPGFSFALETSGYADAGVFSRVIMRMDHVYMDIKLADDTAHRRYTGVSNERILSNLELRHSGRPCVLRTPLVPGITDTAGNLAAIRALAGSLRWEQLPFNELAGAKYPLFGMEYPLAGFSD